MKHRYSYCYEGTSLVPMGQKESEEYRLLRNRIENRAGFIYAGEISSEEQELWYRKYLGRKGDYMFAVYDEAGMFIGGCGIYDVDEMEMTAEFGRILISKKMRGYGYRAVMAAAGIAETCLGIRRLVLHVKKANIPAINIYKKAGFVMSGQGMDGVLEMVKTLPEIWRPAAGQVSVFGTGGTE